MGKNGSEKKMTITEKHRTDQDFEKFKKNISGLHFTMKIQDVLIHICSSGILCFKLLE